MKPHERHRHLPYRYLYWHQNLRCSEPQQVLFVMDCSGRYFK